MADTEFKGKLIDAGLESKPDVITDPEENSIRAKSWINVKAYSPKRTWVEITDWLEKICDFTPEWDVDDGRVDDHWYDYLPDFEALDSWQYDSLDYSTPDVYTTELPQKSTAFGDKFKPSKEYEAMIEDIKYGDGFNKYWRVNAYNSRVRTENKTKRGERVGYLSWEECPSKNHGNYLSDEELIRRAGGKGKQARNARMLLKRRGITTNE